MTISRLFLSAEGRIDRRTYWIGAGMVIGLAVLSQLRSAFGGQLSPMGRTTVAQLFELADLIILYPTLCFASKRLHDLGLSGWWQLIYWGVGAAIVLLVMVQAMNAIGHLPHGDREAMRQAGRDTARDVIARF